YLREISFLRLSALFMKSSPRFSVFAALISLVFAFWIPRVSAQDETDTSDNPGNYGANNPAGVTGIFNGNITTAGSYDPLTRNAKRELDHIVVQGTVGAYPLKMTRYYNSRSTFATMSLGWTHEYSWIGNPDTFITMPNG